MTQLQTIIAGDSHTFCLGVWPPSEDGSPKLIGLVNGDSRFLGWTGPAPRDARYWTRLSEVAAGRKVVILWHGNQHNASFLFSSSPPFDFFLSGPTGLPVDDGSFILPEAAIKTYFEPSFNELHSILGRLETAKPACQAILCGTPPPKQNEKRLRGYLSHEMHFVQFAKAIQVNLQDVPLTPPRLRFKLWMIVQMMLEDVARSYEIPFVPVPISVQTTDGFLAESYWAEDITHANETYGGVMRDHIAATLDLLPTSSE
jgi:hypothetical protein